MRSKSHPGCPSKLTKTQRKRLSKYIEMGPEKMGFPGNCWRTPMIQHLVLEKFGVFYSAKYLSELLNSMNFTYQKVTFVADKRDEEKRTHCKHIILIQDNVPYHTSEEMLVFFYENKNRITVYQLPAYSPDCNPIEKL